MTHREVVDRINSLGLVDGLYVMSEDKRYEIESINKFVSDDGLCSFGIIKIVEASTDG